MSELPRPDNPKPETAEQGPLSRRSLFKKAAKGALAVGGLVVAAKVGLPILFPPGVPPQDEDTSPPTIPRPEGLPKDTLTEKELAKAHIRIIPTEDVKLHLRKGVFEFDIFKDAKEGKLLKEVVVVLVDDQSLSWDSSNKLSEETRLAFQASVINPSEKPYIPYELTHDMFGNPLKQLPWGIEPEMRKVGGVFIKIDDRYSHLNLRNSDLPKGPFPEVVQRKKRYNELLKFHPEMKNKVYIFIAVGGDRKPHPSQSYPSPDEFQEIPGSLGPAVDSHLGSYIY